MQDKEKQIEEMAKIIDDRLIQANCYLGSMNRGEGYWIAQKLIEHYQPKLPENSVVLSREEYATLVKTAHGKIGDMKTNEFIKACLLSGWAIQTVSTEEQIKQARKETAKEFLNMIYWKAVKHIKGKDKADCFVEISFEKLDEIAKQFGVEVEK